MYQLPPVFQLPSGMDLPTCMYTLPQIQGKQATCMAPVTPMPAPASRLTNDCFVELENQQQAILNKLRGLQTQIQRLAMPLQRDCGNKDVVASDACLDQDGVIRNLVITCDPASPPYSLLILLDWLTRSGFSPLASSHVHSSVRDCGGGLRDFFGMEQPSNYQSTSKITLTLIWKQGQHDVSLQASASKWLPIEGESNLARFVSRLMPAPYNYELQDDTTVAETDLWLDLAHSCVMHGDSKRKAAVTKCLDARLAKSDWLAGQKPSIADAVMWSALKQKPQKQPPKVEQWIQRCLALSRSVQVEVDGQGHLNPLFTKDTLLQLLQELGIQTETVEHPEVFTVEAMMEHLLHLPGAHTKNLFLKDKKKNHYLLSAKYDHEVNLSKVAKMIGAKELRFADEAVMFQTLGVKQGCVTALALINDKERAVKFLCDSQLLDGAFEKVYFHPLTNAATTGIAPDGLKRFLKHTGHNPVLVNFVP